MSRFADLTIDIRRSQSYLPPCPLCSHVGVVDFTDMIIGPTALRALRSIHEQDGSRSFVPRFSLTRCCPLSDGCPWFRTPMDAAAWWREKRLQPLDNPAEDNRRLLTLQRLTAANLEAA